MRRVSTSLTGFLRGTRKQKLHQGGGQQQRSELPGKSRRTNGLQNFSRRLEGAAEAIPSEQEAWTIMSRQIVCMRDARIRLTRRSKDAEVWDTVKDM